MRITCLFEQADQLWGGNKVALEDANWLAARGHDVTVISRSGPPAWMELRCAFRRVTTFEPQHLPPSDVCIATSWTTVAPAVAAVPHAAVHLCQGFEGDYPENIEHRERIEAVYKQPGVHRISIAPYLTKLLHERFGTEAHEITYAIDHQVHYPAPPHASRPCVRVGLVGPYQVTSRDVATGIEACRLAHSAGLQLELVRITTGERYPGEEDLPFPAEWHQRLMPAQVGEVFRTLDVFLGTSISEEGFFLPAVEALACGVPCVLTDIPGHRSHGDAQYALFVPPGDAAAMAEALVVAGRATGVNNALRKAGVTAAARYTRGAHCRALEEVLRDIVEQVQAKPPDNVRAMRPIVVETQPSIDPPSIDQPGIDHPGIDQPGIDQPGIDHPGISSHGIDQPDIPIPAGAFLAARTQEVEPRPLALRDQAQVLEMPKSSVTANAADALGDRLAHSLRQGAEELLAKGDHARAARFFSAAHALWPDAGELACESAWCRHLAGDTDSALRAMEELLRNGANDIAIHERHGLLLHAQGRASDAAQAFRAAIAAGGRSANSYNNLGVVLFQSGDTAGARSSFLRALTLDPKHSDAQANLADLPAA